jgi:hypothetical protein
VIYLSLDTWYHVSFDEKYIYWNVDPSGREKWNDKLRWEDIIRICYHPGDFLETDELYIFTNEREESYLIPLEADGAQKLWGEIIERNLFDAGLAIKLATTTDGLFCWPEDD